MITRGTYRNPFNSLRKNLMAAFLSLFALDQDVQNISILIDCAPLVMNASIDLEERFIKMPPVARPRRSASQVVSIVLAKLEAPCSDGFVSEDHATHC